MSRRSPNRGRGGMMRNRQGAVVMSLILMTGGAFSLREPLAREGRPNVVVDVVAMKEVVERGTDGHETVLLRRADTTGPGDTLVYRIVYKNEGSAPAHQAQ